ncbi:hypothetical protein LguiA_024816 [Lonicera macranthoides]
MKRAEIAIISTPGIGNLVPAVEFAAHLTTTQPLLSATILIITIPQRPLVNDYISSLATSRAAANIRFLHLPPVDPPSPDKYQTSIAYLSLLIAKHKPHVKHALKNLMPTESTRFNSVPLAGLFVDMFCTSMIDIAGELGIPSYLYFASPATFLDFMLHLPILDSIVNSELGTELTLPSFANSVPSRVWPNFYLDRKEDGYSTFLHHASRYKETKGFIINTFMDLEPLALNSLRDSPPVYPVGPLIDHVGPAGWHPDRLTCERIIKWLDDQPPLSVVFLCFGSMGSLSGAQVREVAIGLERSGYRFLWSIREPPKGKIDLPSDYTSPEEVLPNGFIERTGEIGLVCGWVPQVTVLAHKATGGFVSHCGWNSIMESLWYGVPIATWPIYAEQQMNAFEMVKELKLAVEITLDYRLGSELVLAEEVERGVESLMEGDSEVREKVKEMSIKCKNALMENGSSHESLGNLIKELIVDV